MYVQFQNENINKKIVNRLILTLSLSLYVILTLSAQVVDVKIKVDNYNNDTLIIGNYFADRQLVKDTLIRTEGDKQFVLQADTLFDQGVYIAITIPDHQYIQFIIPADDQKFKLEMNYDDLSDLKVKDSDENELFYKYLGYLKKRRPENIRLQKELKVLKTENKDVRKVQAQLDALDQEILEYQQKIVQENPNTITAMLISANFQS